MVDIEKTGKDVLDTAFSIHTAFGSGLLEKAYRVILATELRRLGHAVEEEKTCGFSFNGTRYENMFRVDLLVDDAVVVELKSVSRNEPVFAKQCLTYLKILDKRLGFVVNFGMPSLRDGIVRLVNKLETSRTSRTSREDKPQEPRSGNLAQRSQSPQSEPAAHGNLRASASSASLRETTSRTSRTSREDKQRIGVTPHG